MAGFKVVRQGLVGALAWCPLHVADAEQLRSDSTVCTRVLAGLHLAGATLALSWLAVPHPAGAHAAGVLACIAVAFAIGLVLLLAAKHASFTAIELILAFSVLVLITGAIHFAAGSGDVYALFYVVAGLYGFVFLPPRRALLQGALIALAYATVLLTAPGHAGFASDAVRWTVLVGVTFCVGGLVLALSEGLRRGERRFRGGLDASPIGAALLDGDGGCAYANPALKALIGRTALGRTDRLVEFLEDPGATELRLALAELESGARVAAQIPGRLAQPPHTDVLISISQLREREPLHTLVQVQDVSDRVKALSASQHLAAVVESSEDAIFTKDPNGVVLSWNRGAERLYGYSREEMIGSSVACLLPPERAHESADTTARLQAGELLPTFETVRCHRDGRRLDVSVSLAPIRDSAGELTSIAVVARDVTERRHMEREIADSERRYRLMFERNPQPMWVFDKETLRFLAVNDAAIERYGYSREEFLAMTIADIRPRDDRGRLHRSLGSEHERRREGDVWRHLKKNGEVIDVEVIADDFKLDGRPARVVVAHDITARLQAERELHYRAEHDPLTGLWNRARLEREIDAILAPGPNERECALIVFDLDHFKFVNDSFGHGRGDELLRRVGTMLDSMRSEHEHLARFSGDEFGLLLPDADEDAARARAATVAQAIKESIHEGKLRITASAGIAASGKHAQVSSAELLMAADIALYEAKDTGRDRYAVAAGVRRGHTWIDEIRAALAEDRLVLYAQPIIDLGTETVVREELLLRMLSLQGDVIPPVSFIPASERFGLINDIDRWVVTRGLELARTGRRLEINLSAHSLGDREITRMVADAVRDGLDPDNVVFEITETAAAANYREAADFAERLNRIGCGFALDDFGTGFGSLSYLKHVPIAYLKIDMEFVRGLTAERPSQRIVRAIVTIASQLGQKTIAEGVEDGETLGLLRSLGVDHAQGYHIGRPAPAGGEGRPGGGSGGRLSPGSSRAAGRAG